MIISHKYKFIFIKTFKTAGTSIEVFLSKVCDSLDIVTPINPYVYPHEARNYRGIWNPIPELLDLGSRSILGTIRSLAARRKYYNHIPARLLQYRILKDVWNSYYKFCVERNPWDKTLSHYHMVRDRHTDCVSFSDYFAAGQFCLNYQLYTHNDLSLAVDRVLKFETLESELSEVFKILGVPFDGTLDVFAKSNHRNDLRPYQDVYSIDQRRKIETIFSREIEMFGYEF